MSYRTSSKLQWFALFSLGLGFSLVYLDATALNIALPTIQKQFDTSNTELFWIINAYTLAVGSTSLAGGRLGDIIGMRRVYLLGLLIFALSSIAGALAYSALFLIVARVFQGVGGAITLSISLTAIYHIFPVEKQGRATGLFGLSAIFFVLVGPFIGGAFTQLSTWRWIFWLNPIIGLVSFTIIYFLLKGLDEDRHKEATFDYIGQVLLMGVLIPLILGLMQGNNWGWSSAIIILLFGMTLLFLIAFIYSQTKIKHPLFDLSLFKKLNFVIAAPIFFILQFPLAASMYNALYLEYGLGFTPFLSGLALLPGGVLSFIGNPLAGRLVDRWGYKKILQIGLFFTFIAYLWLTLVARTQSYTLFIMGLILVSMSLPLIFVPNFVMVMRGADPKQKGMIAGIGVTFRQAGGAFSIAMMGIITASVHSKFQETLSKSGIYTRSFEFAMLMITIAMGVGFILSFWIDKGSDQLRLKDRAL